jgi:hypothetical protein
MATPKRDPITEFLEEQRALDEADMLEGLRVDSERRLRELKSQVPDGRYEKPGQRESIWGAPEEQYPGKPYDLYPGENAGGDMGLA